MGKNTGGAWAMAGAAAAGLADSLYLYLVLGSGVDHSLGALIVVLSTAALLLAAAALALLRGPVWLKALLGAGALLDLVGTGTAAWFLHAWLLLVFMTLGVIAWMAWLALPAGAGRSAVAKGA